MSLKEKNYRGWIKLPEYHIEVYYRKTQRFIQGEKTFTIDLANFNIDENFQGQGFFTRFLEKIEQLADEFNLVVFVESIFNKRLYDFLLKRGYVIANKELPDSLARIKQNNHSASNTV